MCTWHLLSRDTSCVCLWSRFVTSASIFATWGLVTIVTPLFIHLRLVVGAHNGLLTAQCSYIRHIGWIITTEGLPGSKMVMGRRRHNRFLNEFFKADTLKSNIILCTANTKRCPLYSGFIFRDIHRVKDGCSNTATSILCPETETTGNIRYWDQDNWNVYPIMFLLI